MCLKTPTPQREEKETERGRERDRRDIEKERERGRERLHGAQDCASVYWRSNGLLRTQQAELQRRLQLRPKCEGVLFPERRAEIRGFGPLRKTCVHLISSSN